MELSQEMQTEIKYVMQSKYRTMVMKSLDYPKMPSEIARNLDVAANNVSITLNQLKDHDLVECMNPEVRKGRLYRLTEKGRSINDNLD